MDAKPRYTDDFKTYIVSFKVTGISLRMIARWLDIKVDRVNEWARRPKHHINDVSMMNIYSKAIQLNETGKSIEEISKELNIHINIITFWITGEYVGANFSMIGKKSDALRQTIIDDYNSGMTMQKVADKNNVGLATVHRITSSVSVNRTMHLNEDEINEIIDLYKSGMKIDDIIELTGRDTGCILRYVNRRIPEYRRRETQREYTEEEKQWALQLYKDGYAPRQIAEITGFMKGAIRGWVRNAKIGRPLVHAQRGKRGSNYRHGLAKFPYCEKFDNGFKECAIAYFEYKCAFCGKAETDQKRRLSVHHVESNPSAFCDGSPRVFAALCDSCHPKFMKNSKSLHLLNAQLYEILNNEPYNGKTYYTFDEYDKKFNRCPYEYYLVRAREIKELKNKKLRS